MRQQRQKTELKRRLKNQREQQRQQNEGTTVYNNDVKNCIFNIIIICIQHKR